MKMCLNSYILDGEKIILYLYLIKRLQVIPSSRFPCFCLSYIYYKTFYLTTSNELDIISFYYTYIKFYEVVFINFYLKIHLFIILSGLKNIM